MIEIKDCFVNEFTEIISRYILQFFDTRGKLRVVSEEIENKELVSIEFLEDGLQVVRFFPTIGDRGISSPFYCQIGVYSGESGKKPAENVLRELLKVSEFGIKNGVYAKQRDYGKGASRQLSYKKRSLDLAFELGICSWLTATGAEACTLHTIISQMINWAGRTYEGKNVPFGIVIDFGEERSSNKASYIHFLENDCSAVFSDGIFSGILLDKKGSLISFITRKSNEDSSSQFETFVPYQFSDIAEHCIKRRIGIIVLTNGEIILIKDRAICFAKRGTKWVYFDWSKVYSKLRPYFMLIQEPDEAVIRKNIKAIYCTLLDVSFSHTGGCLALVIDNEDIENVIKDRFDLSIQGKAPKGISKENKEKIEILKYLLENEDHKVRAFFDIEKPLRREILSLDGATVLSLDGSFYCAGSIVAVPGGSSGGGRTAAAKKLAEFGVGIKVSEDGYIEAYAKPTNGENAAHTRIIQLFKIK